MSSMWSFAFLWCFESFAAGAPTEEGKKEQGMQLCQPTEPNASWILPILSHFHASLAIQPRANESHILLTVLLSASDRELRTVFRCFVGSRPPNGRPRHNDSKWWPMKVRNIGTTQTRTQNR